MISLVRPILRKSDAEAIWKHLGGGDGRAAPLDVVFRVRDAVGAVLAKKKRAAERAKGQRQEQAQERAEKNAETKGIRWAVFRRSKGRCEADCGAIITWRKMVMDHFFGKGKVRQTTGNCWALCRECDRLKTANEPSAEHWLERFIAHCQRNGLRAEEDKARARLGAAVLIARAEALRASAPGFVDDLRPRCPGCSAPLADHGKRDLERCAHPPETTPPSAGSSSTSSTT